MSIPKFSLKYQMHRNTLNQTFKTVKFQEPMVLLFDVMRKYSYKVDLNELLKLFKCLPSSGIHMILGWLALLFNAFHQEIKIRKKRIPATLA